MSKLTELREWTYSYMKQFGCDPKVILVSKAELGQAALESSLIMNYAVLPDSRDQLFGYDTYRTEYAPEMRIKQLSFPLTQIAQEWKEDRFVTVYQEYRDEVRNVMIKRLVAHIAAETTHLDVTVECDPWRWLKRLVSKVIRLPVVLRQKTFRIEGRILYPSLQVTLPHERHVVKLKPVREGGEG